MDPLTLFALANGAVSAVKAGCKLYKDIKGAAGEVKDVLKDLDQQFAKLHPPEKPPTVEQKNAFVKEKNRVIELNKKANEGEHTGIYTEIGEHLGTYYDNFYKCMAVFDEEERRAKTEIYTGDASLGKRALQRVLMRKQLEQMSVDLRELMVYQSPPELGALYTEVEEMMKQMGKEQKNLIAKQMRQQEVNERRRLARRKKATDQAVIGIGITVAVLFFMFMMMYIVQLRIEMYPQYGTDWIPKTEEERRRDAEPKIYVGR
jgi:Fe2+ transport system protein B